MIDLADQQAKVEQAIQPQADALALFAALAGLAVLVVIGQLLSRQLITGASDYPVLSALGTDRRQLFGLAMARAGLVSTAGGCLAVAIAVAASPLMPIGPARLAEPDPGVQVNLAILGLGLVAVAVLPVLVIAPVAWHAAGAGGRRGAGQPAPAARSRLARALAGLGGAPAAAIGARMAFEPGRGRSAVPVRSALTGTAVAVAAVVAALVFGASLARLVDTPRLYGQDWTLGLSLGFGSAPASGTRGAGSVLSRVPGVTAYAGGNSGQISIDGQQVAAVGIRPLHGERVPHPARRRAARQPQPDRPGGPDLAAARQARRGPRLGAASTRRAAGADADRRRSDLPLVRRRHLHAHRPGGWRGRLRAPAPAQHGAAVPGTATTSSSSASGRERPERTYPLWAAVSCRR